ncbi:ubiquinone anaerobic biosynthesis accessory factor UbiT [Thermomonas alba]|uniref:ubiquinone anaerobic biosynthesis accessory factor UbiT n=1 Tax=Thermomonas alba TaxID=2888525 RepID=UPI001F036082
MSSHPALLPPLRLAIDGLDDGLLLLLAARTHLARAAGALKAGSGVQGRDAKREAEVLMRGQGLAYRLGMSPQTAHRILRLAIEEGCRAQGLDSDLDQSTVVGGTGIIPAHVSNDVSSPMHGLPVPLLKLVPPPQRLAPLARLIPSVVQARLLEQMMARVLAMPIANGDLDFMADRRIGIEVSDLELRWVVTLRERHLIVVREPAEATVRGSVTDLMLLAGRLEDADTLFFQRRLVLTGDVELGLTARNLLDRLPWETIPLGFRIMLNRGGRFLRGAREAYHGCG